MTSGRRSSKAVTLSLFVWVMGAFLAVGPAYAQKFTRSHATIQVSGTASALKTGLGEAVDFSGPLRMSATVITDPVRPPIVYVTIDGRGVKGIGNKTGKVYLNECEASVHRRFKGTNVIRTTFAFFENGPQSYLRSKTGLLTLNLDFDRTTKVLTKATGSVGTL